MAVLIPMAQKWQKPGKMWISGVSLVLLGWYYLSPFKFQSGRDRWTSEVITDNSNGFISGGAWRDYQVGCWLEFPLLPSAQVRFFQGTSLCAIAWALGSRLPYFIVVWTQTSYFSTSNLFFLTFKVKKKQYLGCEVLLKINKSKHIGDLGCQLTKHWINISCFYFVFLKSCIKIMV